MATPTKRFNEEISATGERMKGATKDAVGSVTGNESLEREGEMENASGRARQDANTVSADMPTPSPYVTGFYREPAAASRAYEGLRSSDYTTDDIDVVMSDETRRAHFDKGTAGEEMGTKAAEGLGVGSAVGGGVGAALAAIFTVGSAVVVPGLGFVVAGPIAAALAGAGAGAATGGLIGALVGAGIPEERARVYEQGVRDGGVVIGARARDAQHAEQLREQFRRDGGTEVLPLR